MLVNDIVKRYESDIHIFEVMRISCFMQHVRLSDVFLTCTAWLMMPDNHGLD